MFADGFYCLFLNSLGLYASHCKLLLLYRIIKPNLQCDAYDA